MQPRALFIAPSYQQASYWMQQWGYKPNEAKWLNPYDPSSYQGYRFREPIYFCGSEWINSSVYESMMIRIRMDGVEIIDAQDINETA